MRWLGRETYLKYSDGSPLQVCNKRDLKGLYRRSRAGQIRHFTSITSPHEEPENAKMLLDMPDLDANQCVEMVMNLIAESEVIALPNSSVVRARLEKYIAEEWRLVRHGC